jgi:hypothetical protein
VLQSPEEDIVETNETCDTRILMIGKNRPVRTFPGMFPLPECNRPAPFNRFPAQPRMHGIAGRKTSSRERFFGCSDIGMQIHMVPPRSKTCEKCGYPLLSSCQQKKENTSSAEVQSHVRKAKPDSDPAEDQRNEFGDRQLLKYPKAEGCSVHTVAAIGRTWNNSWNSWVKRCGIRPAS